MSTQYPQYPQYPQAPGSPQYPAVPPPQGPAAGLVPAGPTYVPLEQVAPPDVALPWWQSQQAINRAALGTPLQLMVEVPDASSAQKYPEALYNKQTRDVHIVKDQKEEQKYTGMGYTTTPFPAQDPNALTPEDLQALQQLWTKAGDALKKLAHLAEEQQKAQQQQAAAQQAPPKK